MTYWQMLYWLLVGHALVDYALQSTWMAEHKNPKPYPYPAHDPKKYGPWWWTMLAHSAINGSFVSLLTGNIAYGIVETVLHFLLDWAKCLGKINAVEDQAGHILSKVLIAGAYVFATPYLY